jgi:uncharacterized membrane protein
MEDRKKEFEDLSKKIEQLTQQHDNLYTEIQNLRRVFNELKGGNAASPEIVVPTFETKITGRVEVAFPAKTKNQDAPTPAIAMNVPPRTYGKKTPIEEFIGTNLLNKIGIAVLVMGIGFGTKYAIDHQLLSHQHASYWDTSPVWP